MHVVINVPDELYNAINRDTYGVHKGRIYDIIRNGTALPKGHGRLIDADAVLVDPFGDTYKDIDIAETIIEADKEE